MIREARPGDVDRIVELGSKSIAEGPYKDQLLDKPEVTRSLTAKMLASENAHVLVAEDADGVFGLFAYILFPHYFSGEMTAGEMIWYVVPEKRAGSPVSLELLWKAQQSAKEKGARRFQLTAPTPEIGRMYSQMRFREIETTYQREL